MVSTLNFFLQNGAHAVVDDDVLVAGEHEDDKETKWLAHTERAEAIADGAPAAEADAMRRAESNIVGVIKAGARLYLSTFSGPPPGMKKWRRNVPNP